MISIPSFNNIDALLKHIEKNIPIDLERIGNEVKGWLRNNVRLLWYERNYSPQYYDRTYELIDSITCSKAKKIGNGEYQVEIFYDINKINTYPAHDGMWSKHESIVNSEDVRHLIPLWIEEGQSSSIFSYEGVHPVEVTRQELVDDNYIKERLSELLEKRGYKLI